MDYKTFLSSFELLKKTLPKKPNYRVRAENSPYGDYIIDCKDVYYGFDSVECVESFYMYDAYQDKNSIDCSYVAYSELCHESIDLGWCYNCSYLMGSDKCTNCSFSMYLTGCQDCFGCVCLSKKQFCFFNKQLSEEEYRKKVAEYLKKKTPDEIMEEVKKLEQTMPRTLNEINNEDSNALYYAYFNKNTYYACDSTGHENSAYVFDSHRNKESLDQTYSVENQSCYETTDCVNCNGCFYGKDLVKCLDCYFSEDLVDCQDCIGCTSLHSKQYCILNKQHTKEEYEKLKGRILGSFNPKLLT